MNRHNWSTIKGKKYNSTIHQKDMDLVYLNIEILLQMHINEISKESNTTKLCGSGIKGKIITIT